MERLVLTEEQVDTAAWERPEAVHYAVHLLHSHILGHLHAFLNNNGLCTLSDDNFLEFNAVIQLCSTAPPRSLVFASLSQEVI